MFFAILDAIGASRKAAGNSQDFVLDSPATCERIRMACADFITEQVSGWHCQRRFYDHLDLCRLWLQLRMGIRDGLLKFSILHNNQDKSSIVSFSNSSSSSVVVSSLC